MVHTWGTQALLRLAKEHNFHNWQVIAEKMNLLFHDASKSKQPEWNAWLCLARYQRSINNKSIKSTWSAADDAALRKAVQQLGTKNWQQVSCFALAWKARVKNLPPQVATLVRNRTGQQCLHRYEKTLKHGIQRGRWNQESDARLALAVQVASCSLAGAAHALRHIV